MRVLERAGRSFASAIRSAHFLNGLNVRKGGAKVEDGYFDDKVLLLYFSSSWCPSCKLLTPKLRNVYEDAMSSSAALEVLWVSRDRTEEQLNQYYEKKLPNFAFFPFGDENIPKFLERYEIKTIPAVRLVDAKGDVRSDSLRPQIEKAERGDAASLVAQWQKLLQ